MEPAIELESQGNSGRRSAVLPCMCSIFRMSISSWTLNSWTCSETASVGTFVIWMPSNSKERTGKPPSIWDSHLPRREVATNCSKTGPGVAFAMTDNSDIQNGLAEIEAEMRRLVAGESVPYDCATNIWSKSMSLAGLSPDLMHPLWLIWGALTDWVEQRPSEEEMAEAAMLRAAREWLAVDIDDDAARKAYLDRWVFEELGYEPEKSCGFSLHRLRRRPLGLSVFEFYVALFIVVGLLVAVVLPLVARLLHTLR